MRVTNLRQVKVDGKGHAEGRQGTAITSMTCIMGQCRARPAEYERTRERERQSERERVVATCCHTNLCIPKLGEKNKTSTLLPARLLDSKLQGLKTLSSHTAGLQSS